MLSRVLRRAALFVSLAVALTLAWSPAKLSSAAPVAAPVADYASVLRAFNPRLSAVQSQDMAAHVLLLSSYYDLDPRLLVAIVSVESGWRATAVSASGARGLGQLMPATAGVLGVLTFDAYENLDGTARYLRRMLQQFPGASAESRVPWALASYNAGPAAVARAGGVPPIPETQTYVARVMRLWHRLQQQLPGGSVAPPAPKPAPHFVARATPAPHADGPRGSVAEFTALEVQSLAALPAPTATPAPVAIAAYAPRPDPVVQRRGVRGWLARVFGSR